MGTPEGRTEHTTSPLRTIVAATSCLAAAALPVWLVGALAIFMAEDFYFTEAQIGWVVAIYFGVAGAGAWTAGRASGWFGSRLSMMTAAVISLSALLGIGLLAQSWVHVAFFVALAGLGSAIAMPATNLALVRGMPVRRMGISFGIKQAAVPFATFLAGSSVPLLALTVGWRYAFIVAVAIAIAVIAMSNSWLVRDAPPTLRPQWRREARSAGSSGDVPLSMALMAVAAGFAVLAATAANAFLVPTLVGRGVEPALAGVLLSVGGLSSTLSRIGVGAYADVRSGDNMRRLAGLYLLGGVGAGLMALAGTALIALLLGIVLTYGAGWGWNGLFHFALVSQYADRPAFATGVAQIGIRSGGVLGPLTFGFIVGIAPDSTAWALVACSLALAGLIVLTARRRIGVEEAAADTAG
ncbi:MAG: MFS transporter [Chloroflexota bacterium]